MGGGGTGRRLGHGAVHECMDSWSLAVEGGVQIGSDGEGGIPVLGVQGYFESGGVSKLCVSLRAWGAGTTLLNHGLFVNDSISLSKLLLHRFNLSFHLMR